jgi:hypothetical protein
MGVLFAVCFQLIVPVSAIRRISTRKWRYLLPQQRKRIMRIKSSISVFLLSAATMLLIWGCAKTQTGSTTAEGDNGMAPMDELKNVQVDLQSQLDAIVEPINSVDGLIEEFNSIVAEAELNAEFNAMATASLEGGEVTMSAEMSVELSTNAELKAKIDAFLEKVKEVGVSLKATPDKASTLLASCTEATAKVPALSAKVTASANAKAANILNKDMAAEGKAELAALADVENEINAYIEDVKTQATDLPAQGAAAMAKLTTAFAAATTPAATSETTPAETPAS